MWQPMYLCAYVVQNLRTFIVLILTAHLTSCGSNNTLKEVIQLNHYPSASGIEYFNNQYYVIGDDANRLLILDSNFSPVDSISLYSFIEKRIPKNVKADLEAITITKDKKLLVAGSGSLSPYRNVAWLIDPVTKQKNIIQLDSFYQRLVPYGIKEINIEGICAIPGSILLTSRGSKGYPKNHLIVTTANFWENQATAPVSLILTGFGNDTTLFSGISGIAYARKSDRLILTVSTEDTRNSMDDGAIGKSYLWIIENISSKKRWKAINPDQVISLEDIDPKFKSQKIESVCVIKETKNFLHLVLAADNDNGSSTLFKLIAEKK
ncbi:MAG: hypothetical protein H7Y01_11690 [Ferruginibacter sp.]|nr:hypothetical protein [Chitinophagaceae bacterium]